MQQAELIVFDAKPSKTDPHVRARKGVTLAIINAVVTDHLAFKKVEYFNWISRIVITDMITRLTIADSFLRRQQFFFVVFKTFHVVVTEHPFSDRLRHVIGEVLLDIQISQYPRIGALKRLKLSKETGSKPVQSRNLILPTYREFKFWQSRAMAFTFFSFKQAEVWKTKVEIVGMAVCL